MKNALRRLLAVFMATFLLAGTLPAIAVQALENGSTSAAYEGDPGNLEGQQRDEGGEPDLPLPPVPTPVVPPTTGGGADGPPTADVDTSFAYVIEARLALGAFGVELWCALLVLANGDTVSVDISNGMTGTGIPEYVVGADSTDPSHIVTYTIDDSGIYTLFPVSPDYTVTPQEGAFQTTQGNPRFSWATNNYYANDKTLYIIRTGDSDYSYTTYTDFRVAPTMSSGSGVRGIVVHSGSLADVVYVENPRIGVEYSNIVFLGVDVGAEDKVTDGGYYLAFGAYWNGVEVQDGLKLDKEYKLGLYEWATIDADGIATLEDPVDRQTARVVYDAGLIRIYDGYFAGAYVPSPDIIIHTFETDGGYLENADLSFLTAKSGSWLTFYMICASFDIAVMYIADNTDPIHEYEYLHEIYPVYPDGFRTEYEHGDVFDLTGLVVMGTYADADFNLSEKELTGFTVNPPHGTVLRCEAEDETEIFIVRITYVDISPVFGPVEHTFSFQIEVAPCAHSGELREETTPATCTEPGEKRFVCTKCDAVQRTEPIAALGHAPGDRVITIEPTYTEKGAWEVRCTVCGTVLQSGEIDALPSKTAAVGAQTGTLTAGSAGTVTFPVTTANIADGAYAATVANLPAGVSVQGQITISNNAGTLTLAGNTSTAAGTVSTLTLTIDGAASPAFTLTIGPAAAPTPTPPTGGGTQAPPQTATPTPTPAPTPSPTLIVDTGPPLSDVPNPFADVASDAWYYSNVMYVFRNDLMNGTSDSPRLFSPNLPTTRGMIVTILYRLSDSPDAGALPNPFDDVAAGAWYANAVKWAAANNVVSGYGGGKFGPSDNITREQLAAILNNYSIFAGLELPVVRDYPDFADDDAISDYAKGSVERLSKAGIVGGKQGNAFDPRGNATRAEVASMLTRLITAVGA